MMKYFQKPVFKLDMTVVIASAVASLYYTLLTRGTAGYAPLYYLCVLLSFMLSLVFVHSQKKELTIALFCACVADYFLILHDNAHHNPSDQMCGMVAFCILQVFFAIYANKLVKRQCWKTTILNMRLTTSLLITTTLPIFHFGLLEILALVYIVNFFITIIILSFHAKTQWLTLIGMILFFICDVFVGLSNFGTLTAYDLSFVFYVPGIFIIAISTVWTGAPLTKLKHISSK